MILRYDSYNRVESPMLTLCNPGSTQTNGVASRMVGVLRGYTDEEINLNFNDISTLNFRLNRGLSTAGAEDPLCVRTSDMIDDYCTLFASEIEAQKELYDKTACRRLVFVSDIGFFKIANVSEHTENGMPYYKDVQAESIEVELRDRKVPYIADGTYPMLDMEISNPGGVVGDVTVIPGMLNMITDHLPLWTIGRVDEVVATRSRTFNDVDVDNDCLSFLRDDIQKAYECIVEFDIMNRLINVYDRESYAEMNISGIYCSSADLVETLSVDEDVADSVTALRVVGDNNTTIASVNPLGGNMIYNFNHYLDWFTPSLHRAVLEWGEAVEDARPTYTYNCLWRDKYVHDASRCSSELDRLNIILAVYQQLYDNIVEANDSQSARYDPDLVKELITEYNNCIDEFGDNEDGTGYVDINDDINNVILPAIANVISIKQTAIQMYQFRLDTDNAQLALLNAAISTTINTLALDHFFTTDQYNELIHYIVEGEYSYEYITITDVMTTEEAQDQRTELYERAVEYLRDKSIPKQEYSISISNLLMAQREDGEYSDDSFAHVLSALDTGRIINILIDPQHSTVTQYYTVYSDNNADNAFVNLIIVGISLNFYDKNLSITVGNKYDRSNPRALFADVFDK